MKIIKPISNVKIYGLEESIKRSKYPMSTDIESLPDSQYIKYWMDKGKFLNDFIIYQDNYGKNKGRNTKDSCMFCGGDKNVQKNNKYDNNYYCSKCNHQITRYGECFETSPKYEVFEDRVECTIYGEKRRESKIIIDAIDLPLVFYNKWNVQSDGYAFCDKEINSLHRMIMGVADSNIIIDHIDRNKNNNRRSNLRMCTPQENSRNCNLSSNNTSGISGASFKKDRNKWRAYITVNNKQISLGSFKNIEEAICARLRAEKDLFGEFAPQRHLFEKYGIENENRNHELLENNKAFKEIIRMYKMGKILAQTPKGCGEDNWLNGVIVQFDLTFSIKAWVEAERYHFLDFISSQSTMHRISKMDIRKQCNEYVSETTIKHLEELKIDYLDEPNSENYLKLLYNVPTGFMLTAGMTTNYRQLKTIYSQRKTHRLPEWRAFCEQLKELPMSEFIMGEQ